MSKGLEFLEYAKQVLASDQGRHLRDSAQDSVQDREVGEVEQPAGASEQNERYADVVNSPPTLDVVDKRLNKSPIKTGVKKRGASLGKRRGPGYVKSVTRGAAPVEAYEEQLPGTTIQRLSLGDGGYQALRTGPYEIEMPDDDVCQLVTKNVFSGAGVEWDGIKGIGGEVNIACRVLYYLKNRWVDGGDRDNLVGIRECCKRLDIDPLMVYSWIEKDVGFAKVWDFLDKVRRRLRAADIEHILTDRAINGWIEEKTTPDKRTGNLITTLTRKQDNRLGLMLMQSGDEVYLKDGDKPVGVSWATWRSMREQIKQKDTKDKAEALPTVTLNKSREAASAALLRMMQDV